jgi:NADH-quinone oxidoreductase subunit J
MTEALVFGGCAALLVIASLRVVTSQNLVRSILWLGISLTATAVLYVILSAPFLAGIQLLLYTGGVITLMLFGVMMTRHEVTTEVENPSSGRLKGAVIALGTFAVLATAILRAETGTAPLSMKPAIPTADIGRSFLTDHLLAFEVLSILLLAAMIAAITIARQRDFGAPREKGRAALAADSESAEAEGVG